MEIGIELHFAQVEGEDYIRKITMWNLQKKERCKTDTRDKKVNEKTEKKKVCENRVCACVSSCTNDDNCVYVCVSLLPTKDGGLRGVDKKTQYSIYTF